MRRRTRDDWTAAALEALADGGLAAVAIEPLAARVGATKGSAYWHFPNREALVTATLERWERDHTEAVIDMVEAEGGDPATRLRRLFGAVLDPAHGPHVELALLSTSDDPLVAAAVSRVNERRIGYLARLLGQLGFARAQARRRAVLAYSVYLGQAQLMRATPGVLPQGKAARRAHLDDVLTTMLAAPV
ncbi:TetR family transcriptional regulator [Herbihabitans rhizosphaerae]|uniref:TetR family transcriptional regulator n=1 Tax=Herbihabitans rhizosphaerae TaxID=1872711 RepID=A0A4Q7KHR3_9PSEU|nr:TetR family transcriptional regulator [Herbihabitans rhizosphaerae]